MRRIRAVFAIIVIAACSAASVKADSMQDLRSALNDRGLAIEASARAGDLAYYTISGSSSQLSVEALSDLSENSVQQAFFLYDTITGWKTMKPLSMVISINGSDVRARVVPQKFTDASLDLLQYVPSGLAFSASGKYVDYEFRVKVDSYFLRFEGRFNGERALVNRLISAIRKPTDFIRDSDPEYALRRIVELDREFGILNEQLKTTQAKLEALGVEVSRIPLLEAEIVRLSKLEDSQDLIARAVMASLSKGLFGAAKAPSEEVVQRVVALKTENQALSADKLLSALKAEGLQADQKQVKAILAVVFGEY